MTKPDYINFPPDQLDRIIDKISVSWRENNTLKKLSIDSQQYLGYLFFYVYKNRTCRVTNPSERDTMSIELVHVHWQLQEQLSKLIYALEAACRHTEDVEEILYKLNVYKYTENGSIFYRGQRVWPITYAERKLVINNVLKTLPKLEYPKLDGLNDFLANWAELHTSHIRAWRRFRLGITTTLYAEVRKLIAALYDEVVIACQIHDLPTQENLIDLGFFND